MLYVSIIFELLRSQPRLVFWLTTLAQAFLWWITPTLFFTAPPGDLPFLLAIGHEFQVGTFFGPPLASWLVEVVYTAAGMPGVYLMSQMCVVLSFWAVFALGCSIVGVAHAAIAVMLMVGVSVFNVATPEFGPSVLAMPITAFMLLHFWRALGEGRRFYWSAVAVETGLLLMTSYAGLIMCVTLVGFTVATARGRAALLTIDPWIAGIVVVVLMFPHLIWLDAAGEMWKPALERLRAAEAINANLVDWIRMLVRVVFLHGGLVVLVVLASGWRLGDLQRVPIFLRASVDPFAKMFVYYHAIVPVLLGSIVSVITGERALPGGTAPLVILSALAIVVAAGDAISLHRQRIVGRVWGLLLALPPVLVLLAMATLPWITGADLQTLRPGSAMGRYFSESFQRRTGHPLEIVAGDPQLAALIALYSRPRAHLYLDATPVQSPWVTPQDIAEKGAVVVWPATDLTGAPPAEIRQRFPDLVVDLQRPFERAIQGRTPLLRVGWGILRPREGATLR
ncbi:MAG: glycosyltransferase family 39 protein [Xanthobacteraceae bacterium]